MRRRHALLLGWLTLALASMPTGEAANKTWTAAVSGSFNTAANWTGGAPTSADTATFDKAGAYTVTFSSSPTNQDLFFQAGNVTFNSSGGPHTYLLNGAGGDDAVFTGGSLTLGASAATAIILNVQDDLMIRGNASLLAHFGSDVATQDLTVGDAGTSAGDGTLTIDGPGSSLTVKGTALLGRSGETGTLTVSNSAMADFGGTLGLADSSTALSAGVFNAESGAA
jgi:T5SS/PEP-CTERM-associated repeat protein